MEKKKGMFARMKEVVVLHLCRKFINHFIVWNTETDKGPFGSDEANMNDVC